MLFVCGPTNPSFVESFVTRSTVAVDKCCVLHIGKADKTPAVYLINNVALPAVLSCRDLGITITHDLSSSMHITDIVAKAHKRGNAILRCFVT